MLIHTFENDPEGSPQSVIRTHNPYEARRAMMARGLEEALIRIADGDGTSEEFRKIALSALEKVMSPDYPRSQITGRYLPRGIQP